MSIKLTENAIPAITSGDVDAKPLVQVISITLLVDSDDSLLRKYYLKLSDGVYSHSATIAAQLNDGVGTGRVKEGSIVKLLDYVCPTIVIRKIIIVHKMETIVLDSQIIGNPKSFVDPELPMVENEEPIPIAALHPYKGKWAIKARVTSKGHLRHYNSPEGYLKAFSFDVLDSDGGEVQVTCLNDVIDSFYEVIEVGKVYLISKAGLIPVGSKDLKHLKIDWEIMLNSNSTVELCPDEDGSIPMHKFSFRSISDIENIESNTILDVIGVVTSVNSSVLMSRENALEMRKRILNLKDNSGRSVELTLWGELCNREGQELKDIVDAGGFPVLAVKAGKVIEFRGKSINAIPISRLFVNPDFPEAQSLRLWFDQDGKDSASSSISKDISYGGPKNELRKTVSQIKDEGLGCTDKPDWITTRATISFMKTDVFCYTACPVMIGDRRCNKKVTRSGERCSKKVTKTVNTRWKCDTCNQEFDVCEYRYILQAQIVDHTGLTCVTAFNEAGEDIMGYSAKDLYVLKYEQEDDERFRDIIKSILFNQFVFRLKIQKELCGEEQKVKIIVVKADKVNYSAESKYMLDLISKFER
ncbi:putative replication factor A protein [Medicago truncatula]|uniref:Replication protein A subunit n=1 Tax=Medicago truncatula TaxID=3880 RepID=A0A396IQR2_MEDTR|nr:replication protein A 70 kDa DNA-binding subunit A [Medicago truncatula]RHN66863.1 putative replication factor A protein [Medicago truncatula]